MKKLWNVFNIIIIKDATISLADSVYDKDIASKLKKKLDEDPDFNFPSVTNPDSNKNYLL